MTKERQKYDREFKQNAVELSFARGYAIEIAEENTRNTRKIAVRNRPITQKLV